MIIKKYQKTLVIISLIFATLLLYFVSLGNYPLMEPDEGRYAEIAREMVESGDYITPRLNYVHYFEKPPLLYWLNAISFKFLGQNEFAARLATASLAILGAVAVAILASVFIGFWGGILSYVITVTSLLYYAIGSITITDMPLSTFITIALVAFFIAHKKQSRISYIIFYLSLALGVLTKGLVAIVLPAGIIFWYIVLTRQWQLFYKSLYLPGIILFFVIIVSYFYPVCAKNPDFFYFFFIREHFLRYATKMHARYQPFWYFLPMIPAGIVPWTAFLPSIFSKKGLRGDTSEDKKHFFIYLALWFSVILLFFSFSNSKLIPYIVPCFPPLAVLIAANLVKMQEQNIVFGSAKAWLWVCNGLLALALFSFPIVCYYLPKDETTEIGMSLFRTGVISSIALISMPILFTVLSRKKVKDALIVLCFASFIFMMSLHTLFPTIAEVRTLKFVSEYVLRTCPDDVTLVSYREVLQGLSFYTTRRVLQVEELGELEFGASKPSAKSWFLKKDEFLPLWKSKSKYAIVVRDDMRVEDFFTNGVSYAKKAQVGKYLVFTNFR